MKRLFSLLVLLLVAATVPAQVDRAHNGPWQRGLVSQMPVTISWHEADGIAIWTTGNGWHLEPTISTPPVPASGQDLVAEWEDQEGVLHRVVTHVPPTTNTIVYIRRHDALFQEMKSIYPPKG